MTETAALLDSGALERMCRAAGADDVGFVELGRASLAGQRDGVLRAFPWARTYVVFVRRFNRTPLRAPLRSVASAELSEGERDVKAIIHRVVREIESGGVRAVGVSGLFPNEVARTDGSPFIVSLKPLAEEAGLGHMGKSRMVLHPRFGTYIYLAAIMLDRDVTSYSRPLPASPCLDCNLCAAVCPTGAIAKDGHFDFQSCMTHNYREKGNGFVEWIHTIADSRNRRDYRRRVSDTETVSWWQSLGYDPNIHCAYCVAACPAGAEADVFRADRKAYFREIAAPLRDRAEAIYAVPGSDAEAHVRKNFPHKSVRPIRSGVSLNTAGRFVRMLPLLFQRGQSKGLSARYHFRFHGCETLDATVEIRDQKVRVTPGLEGRADLTITADADAWTGLLARERRLWVARCLRRIRLQGPRRLLADFRRCLPV